MSDAPTPTQTASGDAVHDDSVHIVVPLRAEHAATLRVVVSSLGSDHGLNVDEIDDLKLAVSEIFTLLIDDAEDVGASRAHVRYSAQHGEISIELSRGLPGDEIELDALAATILSSVVDEYNVDEAGVSLIKRASRRRDLR